MPRATAVAPPPEPPTAASIITLVEAIEVHPAGAPAAVAFRLALARKGREADAAGGGQALDDLLREVALADPAKADARTAIILAAWTGLSGWSS